MAFSGVGWLQRVESKAKNWADVPAASLKFTDPVMLNMIEESMRELFTDIMISSEGQVVVRHNITVVEDQTDYVLPPNVGQIYGWAKINEDYRFTEYEIKPSTHWDPTYTGFLVEGNLLRMLRVNNWLEGETLELWYVPNGDLKAHEDTITVPATPADMFPADGLSVIVPTAEVVTAGEMDLRQNAYAGCIFRVLGVVDTNDAIIPQHNMIQDRIITSSTIDTTAGGTAGDVTMTLARPLNPLVGTTEGDKITYEIVPVYSKLFEDILALHIGRSMCATVSAKDRFDLLTRRYVEKARAMRLQLSKWQVREASRFDGRTYDNRELGDFWRIV